MNDKERVYYHRCPSCGHIYLSETASSFHIYESNGIMVVHDSTAFAVMEFDLAKIKGGSPVIRAATVYKPDGG